MVKRLVLEILSAVFLLSLFGCDAKRDDSSRKQVTLEDILSNTSAKTDVKSDSALQQNDDYFTENGIELRGEPCYFETKAVEYDGNDPHQQAAVTVSFEPQEVTVTQDPEDPAYKIVTLKVVAAANARYDTDAKTAWDLCFSSAVLDRYTGRILPEKVLSGDEEVENALTLEYKGNRCELVYSKKNVWDSTLFEEEKKQNYLCETTYRLKVPAEYDGLVFGGIAQTQYFPDGEDPASGQEPYYVMDLAEQEGFELSQSVFFCFGQENPAAEGAPQNGR